MTIEELTRYSQQDFRDLHELMAQLSQRLDLTQPDLVRVLKNENSHMYVMRTDEGRIVGTATLCVYHAPSGTKAMVEDVVVASDFRGRHLGRQLMEHILDEAAGLAPIEIHLTSNPKRVAANALYQSLGFERQDTNCYVYRLKHNKKQMNASEMKEDRAAESRKE